ncbi:hypothetical protein [uncultured Bifidobacterium sp.]|uniref:hypothetical protein n=1 Tax=uncultured Bifidobacterium sp. TaxID=165187 RepID=UPI002595CA7A|nr:hypothetical protein [uncultured Bifidobacterium sp.]
MKNVNANKTSTHRALREKFALTTIGKQDIAKTERSSCEVARNLNVLPASAMWDRAPTGTIKPSDIRPTPCREVWAIWLVLLTHEGPRLLHGHIADGLIAIALVFRSPIDGVLLKPDSFVPLIPQNA